MKNEQKNNEKKINEQKLTSSAFSAYIKSFDYFIYSVHAVARLFLILFFLSFDVLPYVQYTIILICYRTHLLEPNMPELTHASLSNFIIKFMGKHCRWNDEVTRNIINWNCIMKNICKKKKTSEKQIAHSLLKWGFLCGFKLKLIESANKT